MSQGSHHIDLTEEFMTGFPFWLVSGSPGRTEDIFSKLDIKSEDDLIETGRGLPIARGYVEREIAGKTIHAPVGLLTTGMGMGSTEITIMELVDIFAKIARINGYAQVLRVGTGGSHQPEIYGGDLVIGTETYAPFGAISDLLETSYDNPAHMLRMGILRSVEENILANLKDSRGSPLGLRSRVLGKVQYALAKGEIGQAPSCDPLLAMSVQRAIHTINERSSGDDQFDYHFAPMFSKQTLYSECSDAFPINAQGIRAQRLEDRAKVMHDMGIGASEMEIAMINTITYLARQAGYNVRSGAVAAVLNNPRCPGEAESPLFANATVRHTAEQRAIYTGLETAIESHISPY
jgi:uridine phosphorylase